jgi:ribosomal-protein-alanine N-acetyltransferase
MNRAKQPRLNGKRIYLREYKLSDAKENAQVWNDKEIARWITDIEYPTFPSLHRKWIKINKKRNDAYYYAIILKETNRIMGCVWFHDIYERTNYQIADIGYLIGREFRGKGYATEAAKLIIKWGFRKLNFLKITAKINVFDKASIKVIKKLGFKLEGKTRKQTMMKFPKKWCDELNYGLLKREWKR